MAEKYNKPLIIITAALSIAVITLSVQVVLLTFSVKDQKDATKQLIARTNSAYAVENRYAELNGMLQQHTRDIDHIRNDTISLNAELASFRDILSKLNTAKQFNQMELDEIRDALKRLEEKIDTSHNAANSVGAAYHEQPVVENQLYPTPYNSFNISKPKSVTHKEGDIKQLSATGDLVENP